MIDRDYFEEKYPHIVKELHKVYDPEIPLDIFELGLIYNINIDENNRIEIDMTLTSPACPVAETLPPMVERAIMVNVKEATSAIVTVVWEPPWDQTKMSEEAKLELGMF